MCARERLVSRVYPLMGVQVVLPIERLVALGAGMRSIQRMSLLVADEIALIPESFPTYLRNGIQKNDDHSRNCSQVWLYVRRMHMGARRYASEDAVPVKTGSGRPCRTFRTGEAYHRRVISGGL